MENMNKPDGERIATLEQHMVDQDKKLDQIVADVRDVKSVLQVQLSLKTEIVALKEEVVNLKGELKRIQDSRGLWSWLVPTLAAIAGSVLTILIISYIDKFK